MSNAEASYVDSNKWIKTKNKLEKKIQRLHRQVQKSEEAQIFKKVTQKEINIGSPKQLNKLFFEVSNNFTWIAENFGVGVGVQ